MKLSCNTYADFKTAVAAYLGSKALVGYSPLVAGSGVLPQAGASNESGTQFVVYAPPSNPGAVDAPTIAQFQADFPNGVVFTNVVEFNG